MYLRTMSSFYVGGRLTATKQNHKNKTKSMDQNENTQPSNPELAQQYDPNDPFAGFARDTDTSRSILPAGLYDLEVKSAEVGRNKDDTGDKIAVEFVTTADTSDVKGEPVNKGFPVFHNFGLTETPKFKMSQIRKAVDSFLQAAGLGDIQTRAFINNPSLAVGRTVRCKVGVKKETSEFPAGNNIKEFVKV